MVFGLMGFAIRFDKINLVCCLKNSCQVECLFWAWRVFYDGFGAYFKKKTNWG